jgi:hypothetical protein
MASVAEAAIIIIRTLVFAVLYGSETFRKAKPKGRNCVVVVSSEQ